MGAQMDGHKIGSNVVIVFFKFSVTMWENELHCLEDSSPSDNPISMGFNGFGGFSSAEMHFASIFKISNPPSLHSICPRT